MAPPYNGLSTNFNSKTNAILILQVPGPQQFVPVTVTRSTLHRSEGLSAHSSETSHGRVRTSVFSQHTSILANYRRGKFLENISTRRGCWLFYSNFFAGIPSDAFRILWGKFTVPSHTCIEVQSNLWPVHCTDGDQSSRIQKCPIGKSLILP